MLRMQVALMLSLAAGGLYADQWSAPQTFAAFSPDGQRFVRIYPGCTADRRFGYDCSRKGEPAMAEFFHRQRDHSYRRVAQVLLSNPIAPGEVWLTNQGQLITFDNWHERGHGKVVAIYDSRGKRLAAYELTDLLTREEIDLLPSSVSSREWRCDRWPGFYERGQKLHVALRSGGDAVFELSSGAFTRVRAETSCESP